MRDLREVILNAQAMVMETETNQILVATMQAILIPAVKMVAIVMQCSVESVESWIGIGKTVTRMITYITSRRFEEPYT